MSSVSYRVRGPSGIGNLIRYVISNNFHFLRISIRLPDQKLLPFEVFPKKFSATQNLSLFSNL